MRLVCQTDVLLFLLFSLFVPCAGVPWGAGVPWSVGLVRIPQRQAEDQPQRRTSQDLEDRTREISEMTSNELPDVSDVLNVLV